MSSAHQFVEHIILFKVKDGTDPSRIASMVSRMNSLISLDQVLHLTAGPIHRILSSPFDFTLMLHSRYRSKEDLNAYLVHPFHVDVRDSVFPFCDDVMAVDWIPDDLAGPVVLPAGSAMRVTFSKLKEGSGDAENREVLKAIENGSKSTDRISFGKNFSPARAKGFSIVSVAMFPGLGELNGLDSSADEKIVKLQKENAGGYLESVMAFDYVIPASQSASS
ncbi:stress-response A/B barrel domain-containing protein UP3-like [Malania oleifera]|uniref:stress-response A/B barrel domain-containing protein UP3-like n=1 Tax=Malania oleifera TaxID=397392 RepID=UPI0025AE4A90|nr:stress-response A/B barrel domain-containing protein UP3-like [Malania oleifera]